MSTYPSELIACVAILIAVMIFRELPSAVRVPLSFSASGTAGLAAVAALANGTML
jgi:hypothetical protein